MSDERNLFVGLGNPGSKHAGNRHNIGFMAIDAIAAEHKAGPWRSRFQGEASEASIGGERVVLLKPATWMNLSGNSVADAVRFFKIPLERVVIFHDELDLPPAKLRVKTGGGVAGHNGLRSISPAIGNDYRRVRLGIGHPGDKARVHGWVLSDFAKADRAWVEDICAACAVHAPLLAAGKDATFQSKVHLYMADRGHGEPEKTEKAGPARPEASE